MTWDYSRNGNSWAFYPGADIVFIHGLKVNHLKDLLSVGGSHESWTAAAGYSSDQSRNTAVKTKWVTPTSNTSPASGSNPLFYTGYFKKGAEYFWNEGERQVLEGHIPVFLRGGTTQGGYDAFVASKTNSLGYSNRYLIVSYNCADDLKNASRGVLRQIADAIRFNTGVVNPIHGGAVQGFGSRGIVLVSHSTGGLVTNVSMQLAKRQPSWGASWIPDYVKLHVASEPAMSGSRIATAAIVTATASDMVAAPLLKDILAGFGLPIPIGSMANELSSSILMDLVPTVSQARWGRYFNNVALSGKLSYTAGDPASYIPPTLCVPSNHPTYNSFMKYGWVLPGLDDGVVNANSASGNPNISWRWPSGFLGSPTKNFDIGIWADNGSIRVRFQGINLTLPVKGTGMGHKKRARRFYLDMKDVILIPAPMQLNPDKAALIPAFFAAGPNYRLSPVGMLQDYYSNDPYRHKVMDRYPNMFTAISSSADHSDGSTGGGGGVVWSNYQVTHGPFKNEENTEETVVVGEHDLGVYTPFTPPAFRNQNMPELSRPVLSGPLPQNYRVRGIRVTFKLFGKVRSFWIAKRSYLTLANTEGQMKFDAVYWNVLGGGR